MKKKKIVEYKLLGLWCFSTSYSDSELENMTSLCEVIDISTKALPKQAHALVINLIPKLPNDVPFDHTVSKLRTKFKDIYYRHMNRSTLPKPDNTKVKDINMNVEKDKNNDKYNVTLKT